MSKDREMDHLEMMSGMIDRHHNQPCCYAEIEPERDELSDEEMLAHGKCELIGAAERVAQLAASVTSTFYHTNLVSAIRERIGEGDAMHLLLRDSYVREKFHMKAGQW